MIVSKMMNKWNKTKTINFGCKNNKWKCKQVLFTVIYFDDFIQNDEQMEQEKIINLGCKTIQSMLIFQL